jgi:hypothetical protein
VRPFASVCRRYLIFRRPRAAILTKEQYCAVIEGEKLLLTKTVWEQARRRWHG